MKHIFIINPAAGKGDSLERLEADIKNTAERLGTECEIYRSVSVGDAEIRVREYCEKASGAPVRFYACGGDGTVNEVFNGTAGFPNAQVGIIPIGTGNDFVKNFGSVSEFFDLDAQMKGNAIAIDGIRINDKYAVNMVNMGFDCSVVETVQKIKRHPWISSKMAYIAGVVIEFAKLPGTKLKKLVIDGKSFDKDELQLCAFANGGFYGGGFHNAPLARPDDGMMDACIINRVSRLQFVSMIGSYKKGTYLENKRIMRIAEYHKCRTASIDFEGEMSVCVDGEITRLNSLELEMCPEFFKLSLPVGIKYDAKEINDEAACPV